MALLLTLNEIAVADHHDHYELFETVARWSELSADERARAEAQIEALRDRAQQLGFSVPLPLAAKDVSPPLRW